MARTRQTARKTQTFARPHSRSAAFSQPKPVNTSKPKVVNLVDLDPTLDPTCMKVMDLKEKLQRAMVQAAKEDGGINEKDMPDCDELFKELAQQPMTLEYLHHTKVVKVIKQIRDMEDGRIPLETEYKFKERAAQLLDSWKHLPGMQLQSAAE